MLSGDTGTLLMNSSNGIVRSLGSLSAEVLSSGIGFISNRVIRHSQITTTLAIYTIPVPAHQRAAVENGDEFQANGKSGVSEPQLLQ